MTVWRRLAWSWRPGHIELGYFNYVDEDVLVIADAEQMKRVINNIIGNSVKYMDKPKGHH